MTNFFKKIFSNQISENETDLKSICPYCKNILEQKPTRKKKCPFCNNFIYVRTLPTNKKKVLVTENDAKKIEMEWDKINYRKSIMQLLGNYGITEKEYDKRKKELTIKLTSEANDRDVIWSLFNELIMKKIKNNELGELYIIYYQMALFCNRERRDCFHLLKSAAEMYLLHEKQSGITKKVKINTMGTNSCEACQKLNGKVFTIEEALEKMPIPCKECTHKQYDDERGFCRCQYTGVFD
ncbi:MAG: hypothetical protein Q8O92_03700 [Candidatus Latescibacter sp.]|nr:hypothetical protein [Candidatus Latescibacter sp.]